MKLFALVTFLFMTTYARAIVVYSAEIDKFNTGSKNGIYNKFLEKLEKVSKSKFEIKFLPPLRAKKKFEASSNTCYFPLSLDDVSSKNSEILLSKPIGDIFLYGVRLRKSTEKKTESFAYRSLYKDGTKFQESLVGYPVASGGQLLEMLDRKRVDFIYVSIPDIYLYFSGGKDEFMQKYKIDRSISIKQVRDYFACKNTQENKSIIQKINKIL